MTSRFPVFSKNYAYNLGQLNKLIEACRARGLHPVLLDTPRNTAVIGPGFDKAVGRYRTSCRQLAAKYGIPFVDMVAAARFTSTDFYDLWHAVQPGRAKVAAAALRPDGPAATALRHEVTLARAGRRLATGPARRSARRSGVPPRDPYSLLTPMNSLDRGTDAGHEQSCRKGRQGAGPRSWSGCELIDRGRPPRPVRRSRFRGAATDDAENVFRVHGDLSGREAGRQRAGFASTGSVRSLCL